MPGNRLVRIQLNGFSSLTDTPAVTAAAPTLIITSQMRMQPLHVYSWHWSQLQVKCTLLVCSSVESRKFDVFLFGSLVPQDAVPLQAFVAQAEAELVGIVIIKDKQVLEVWFISKSVKCLTI